MYFVLGDKMKFECVVGRNLFLLSFEFCLMSRSAHRWSGRFCLCVSLSCVLNSSRLYDIDRNFRAT